MLATFLILNENRRQKNKMKFDSCANIFQFFSSQYMFYTFCNKWKNRCECEKIHRKWLFSFTKSSTTIPLTPNTSLECVHINFTSIPTISKHLLISFFIKRHYQHFLQVAWQLFEQLLQFYNIWPIILWHSKSDQYDPKWS